MVEICENSQIYAPSSLVGNVDELKFQENISENVFMCKSSEIKIDYKPPGGNVYLYALKLGKKTDEEWKCDGYTFW